MAAFVVHTGFRPYRKGGQTTMDAFIIGKKRGIKQKIDKQEYSHTDDNGIFMFPAITRKGAEYSFKVG